MSGAYSIHVFVETDGSSPYEDFERSLDKPCRVSAHNLRKSLEAHGPKLPKHKAHDVGGGIWELRGSCEAGAIRIYYFRSGSTDFTLICGEVKTRNQGSKKLIEYARRCKEREEGTGRN